MSPDLHSASAPLRGVATADYPQRAPYFAHRYCRLLTKTCAAQDIGHIAFVLCVTVAHQEDAKRYRGPVTFFNEQLMPLIGVTKWEALDSARRRAVEAGWLYYAPGNRGQRKPGRYWVTLPSDLEDLNDAACDESQYPRKGEWGESQHPANRDRDGERDGDRGGEHSTLPLNPNPEKAPARASVVASEAPAGLPELIDGWNSLPSGVVKRGNGARRDPPSRAAIAGWNRAMKIAEQRNALQDIPRVLEAIRGAKFCHSKPWFTVPWLFGRNKNGEFNILRLLEGGHDGDSDTAQTGIPKPRYVE